MVVYKGAIAIFSVNGVLLLADAVLAFFVLRPHRQNYARESWYLLLLATICLAVVHVANTAVAAWNHVHQEGEPHTNLKIAMIFPFAYILCTLGACRTVFWEITSPAVFKAHNRVRYSLLFADAMLVVLLAFVAIVTASVELPTTCYDWEPCSPLSMLFALESLTGGASVSIPAMIWFAYCTIAVGAFFARKWANIHGINTAIANAMFRVVVPMLMVQAVFHVLALIFTAWMTAKFDPLTRYLASIPFWIRQDVVLGALIWAFRTRPINRKGFAPLAGSVAGSVNHSHIELAGAEQKDMPSGPGVQTEPHDPLP